MDVFWLVPVFLAIVAAIWVLYRFVKVEGGSGVKTEGRSLYDDTPDDKTPLPPRRD